MLLPLTSPCSRSRMGMLLLVSSLLLWEHVTSNSNNQMSNEDLCNKMLLISDHIRIMAREMYKTFDAKLSERKEFKKETNNTCLTAALPTPKTTEDILKVIINVSNAWKYPLKLLIPATLTHLGSYNGMLANVTEVEHRNKQVLDAAKILLSNIQPGFEENDNTNRTELRLLRSSNEDIHLLAFHKLFFCLGRDTQRIHRYLKILRRRIIRNN